MPDEPAQTWMDKVRRFLRLDTLSAGTRKIVVSLIGGLILVLGIVMLITPGPAFVVIPLGLLLLASEYEWAGKALEKVMEWGRKLRQKWKRRNSPARSS